MFLKNSFWLTVERVTRVGVGFLVGLAVIRHLGPERYSVYAYAVSAAMLLAPLAKFGLEQLAIREFVNQRENAGAVFRAVFALRLVLGLGCATAMVAALDVLAPTVPRAVVIAAAVYLVVQPLETAELWLQSRSLFYLGGVGRAGALLAIAAVKIFLIVEDAPLVAFVWAWVAESVIASLWSLAIVMGTSGAALRGRAPAGPRFPFDVRENLSLVLTTLVVVLYFRIDALLLPGLIGKEEAGRYLAALPVIDALGFLGSIIAAVMFPILMSRIDRDPKGFWELFGAGLKVATWVGIATGLAVAAASLLVLPLALGPRYEGTAVVAAIIALTLPILFQGAVVDAYILGYRKMALLATKSAVALAVKIVLFAALAPRYGIDGAAAATVVAVVSSLLVTALVSREVCALQFASFRPAGIREDIRRVITARS